MPSVKDNRVAAFMAVARVSAREFIAYPADVISEFFTYPIVFLCYYFFLQAISIWMPESLGMPLTQLALYYSLGWLLRMVFHQRIDTTVSELIAHGDIANQLLRPLELKIWLLAQATGYAGARLIFYALPGVIMLVVLSDSLRSYVPIAPLYFFVSTICGFLILFELQLFIGGIAFYSTMNFQLSWTLDMLIRLLSGLVVPLTLLPVSLQQGLAFLPFPHIYAYPIQAWIAPPSEAESMLILLRGCGWLTLLYCLNQRFYKQSIQRMVIYGG